MSADSLSCCAGLYYGAEAHLVTNLTISGKSHLVVFGESPSIIPRETDKISRKCKCDLYPFALPGVWMDISGNQTNQLYSTLQPYVDSSSGAVSLCSYSELSMLGACPAIFSSCSMALEFSKKESIADKIPSGSLCMCSSSHFT